MFGISYRLSGGSWKGINSEELIIDKAGTYEIKVYDRDGNKKETVGINITLVNYPKLEDKMIPIKWNGTKWVVTTESDPYWYDYGESDNKKWANVMMSNSKYAYGEVSDGKELDNQITDTTTIDNNYRYVWIPRYAYNNGIIKFLRGNSMITTDYTSINENEWTQDFNDKTGIWVKYTELETNSISEKIYKGE